MNIFKINENIKSYKYPVVKMIVELCIFVVLQCVDMRLIIENAALNITIRFVFIIIKLAMLHCVFISIAEMFFLSDRNELKNKKLKKAASKGKDCNLDDVISLLTNNNIIDILIFWKNKIIRIGASSDSLSEHSELFDKRYYIDEQDNVTVDEIRRMFEGYSKIRVITIDGVSPQNYNI